MRNRLGRLWLICLALLIALAGTGVGYAHWSDTLIIKGEIKTGELDWELMPRCCCCFCLRELGDGDCPGRLEKSLARLWSPLRPDGPCQHLRELLARFDGLEPSLIVNHCQVEQKDIDGDLDTDRLAVTLEDVGKCCGGWLTFKIHNNGSIPARITGINIQPLNFTNGEEVRVRVLYNPSGRVIDPVDNPGTFWDETSARCVLGILVKEPGTYFFDVSVEADYWTAP